MAALALSLAGCGEGHGARARTGHVPFPVAFPDIECEPGPEPAEVSVFPDRIDLAPGETATVEVDVVRHGFCGSIDVAIDGLPGTVQAEPVSAPWPTVAATVQLKAADVLTDEIRNIQVHTTTSQESWVSLTLRTREAAEPDWSDELVGIRHTRVIWLPTMGVGFDGSRIVFSDYDWTAPDEITPLIHCIRPGIGRCTDFGESGSVSWTPVPDGHGAALALAPDGSYVVTDNVGELDTTHSTRWARLTASGEISPFPGVASAATGTWVGGVLIDATGRILFTSEPDGWSTPSSLFRLNPDGSLDDSFADGELFPAGRGPIRVLSDGRIVLHGAMDLLWLENDGTPIGPPVPTNYCCAIAALDNGSVLYGQLEDPDSVYEKGTVNLVDSRGTLLRRWELGPLVWPRGLAVRDGDVFVVANVGDSDSGLLRLFRLPFDGEPILLAERTVGRAVWSARMSSSGPLVIVGDREFRLPDGGVGWTEAYLWRVE